MMTQPFLITGLPRSRTAWMAAVCNLDPHAICQHEPIQNLKHWHEALSLWAMRGYTYTGISDSSLGFHLLEILDRHAPNTLIILRDREAVELSLEAMGVYAANYCRLLHGRIQAALRHPLVMSVGFEELRDPNVVCDALRWLMPGCAVDREKVATMCRFNITVDVDQIMDKAIAANPDDILGADVANILRAM
jgi:hypothetical protein